MKRVLHRSICRTDRFQVEDLDILRSSLSNNRLFGITGFLYRTDIHFFQCLDGPSVEVDILLQKIRRDPRHSNFCTLLECGIHTSAFLGWSMGYSNSRGSGAADGIGSHSTSEDVLRLLIREAEGQRRALWRKAKEDLSSDVKSVSRQLETLV